MKHYVKFWQVLSENELVKKQTIEYKMDDHTSLKLHEGAGAQILQDWELIHSFDDGLIKADLQRFAKLLLELVQVNRHFITKITSEEMQGFQQQKLHLQWTMKLEDKINALMNMRSKTAVMMAPAIFRKFLSFGKTRHRSFYAGDAITKSSKTEIHAMKPKMSKPTKYGFPDCSAQQVWVRKYGYDAYCYPYYAGSLEWMHMCIWGIINHLSFSITDWNKQYKHALPQWNAALTEWSKLCTKALRNWDSRKAVGFYE